MDLDGDGFISMYEMDYFYAEQIAKMDSLGIETLPFEDCLCMVRKYLKYSNIRNLSFSILTSDLFLACS